MSSSKPRIPVEDRLELHDLIARYAWALDTGDVEGYVECFFEDGWIEHHPPGLCKGREAIRKLTEFLWYEHGANYLGRQHRMSQVLMSPEEGGVRIRAFWSIRRGYARDARPSASSRSSSGTSIRPTISAASIA